MSDKKPLTQLELDELRCSCGRAECADTKIYLRSRCCRSGSSVYYDRMEAAITIECDRCKKEIVKIKVAAGVIGG